jgi:hypothetical protein
MPANSSNVIRFRRKADDAMVAEYRQRMRSNAAAAAVVLILLVASYWIIDILLSIPGRPDCNFSVRRPCHVNVSPKNASLTDAF